MFIGNSEIIERTGDFIAFIAKSGSYSGSYYKETKLGLTKNDGRVHKNKEVRRVW